MIKENEYLHLVAQARLGDRDSMSELAAYVCDRLRPYLHRVTLDSDLSQDLLQEVLLTMVCFVDRLDKPENFWPWIYGVAQSKIQQHFRSQHRRDILLWAVLDDAYHNRQRRSSHSVLEHIVHKEKLERLSIAIKRLDKPYREVVQLRCFEEMAYSEIASLIRCSPQQARIRFFRAKQSLRGSLFVQDPAKD